MESKASAEYSECIFFLALFIRQLLLRRSLVHNKKIHISVILYWERVFPNSISTGLDETLLNDSQVPAVVCIFLLIIERDLRWRRLKFV